MIGAKTKHIDPRLTKPYKRPRSYWLAIKREQRKYKKQKRAASGDGCSAKVAMLAEQMRAKLRAPRP